MTPRRFLCLLPVVAALVALQPASAERAPATNSSNMRLDYSLIDTTAGRTHSDIAFWGNIAVAGNYDGFRVFNTQTQQLITTKLCRGPQNDVSLWEHNGRLLLFLSNDTPQTNGATTCSALRSSDTSACGPACFEGIRIFDLTDPANPVLIRSVYTDCGSHTHTLIPDPANSRLLLYISSYPGSTGPNCASPFRKISIVQVPLDSPETASVLSQPQLTANVPGCHDITVFLAIHKAAASCANEGQIWDITDPANPGTTNPVHVTASGVNYWHSAEFTWDGQYVVWDDESFTGTCQSGGDGRIRVFRVSDAALMSSFMIPRAQSSYCSVHNGNIIPVAGRYLLVAAWYYGGTSVVDFTNPAQPQEIAYYDADGAPTTGEVWSSYWYNGRIYANDMRRGQDVFTLAVPYSPYAATWPHLNAQTQENLLPPSITSTMPVARLTRGAGALAP
ncbi:MAG: hypothetical protein AABM30_09925 [Actinomycetota bacterium]